MSARDAAALEMNHIHLSPTGRGRWNGECHQTICSAFSPCLISGSTTVSGACDIILGAGNYNGHHIFFKRGNFAEFDFIINGTVENLNLEVDPVWSPSVRSFNNKTADIINSSIEYNLLSNVVLDFSNLNFIDSTLSGDATHIPGAGSSWNFHSCQVRMSDSGTTKSFISITEAPSAAYPTEHYFSFQQVTAELNSNVLVTSNAPIALSNIAQSKINGALSVYRMLGSVSVEKLQIMDSSSVSIKSALIAYDTNTVNGLEKASSRLPTASAALPNALIYIANSVVSGASAPNGKALARLSQGSAGMVFTNATISGLNINCATDSWRDATQAPLTSNVQWLQNITFHNCGSCWG